MPSSATSKPHIAVVLGASGFVGAELLRLIYQHGSYPSCLAVANSAAGDSIASAYPHLSQLAKDELFVSPDDLKTFMEGDLSGQSIDLYSALPHGESAAFIAAVVAMAQQQEVDLKVVDIAADFRFAEQAQFEEIYGGVHAAPELISQFVMGPPDLMSSKPHASAKFASQPGCFATAVSLAMAPMAKLGHLEGKILASCVTGSTGSGKVPQAGTHHPFRDGNMWSYKALAHRHEAEMCNYLSGDDGTAEVLFVPHSGPFARGIHATLHGTLKAKDWTLPALHEHYADFYAHSPFVEISQTAPNLRQVVGSNNAVIGLNLRGQDLVVTCVIDNLIKGAAGGAMQWMNIIRGREQNQGLKAAALCWS